MRGAREYKDFVVRVGSDGRGGLEVELRHPAGTPAQGFQLPFDPSDLLPLLEQRVRGRSAPREPAWPGALRHLRPPEAWGNASHLGLPVADREPGATLFSDPLAEIGATLFSSLLPGALGRRFDRARTRREGSSRRGVRLRLVLDAREPGIAPVAALPWELLLDPERGDFLCRNLMTPVVRFLEGRPAGSPPRARLPLRILAFSSAPPEEAPLDLDREHTHLREAWRQHHVEVDFLPSARLTSLRERLREKDFHILHLMGHGEFDRTTGESRLLLADEEGGPAAVSGGLLAETLLGFASLRLVVLNTCDGARLPRREGVAPFSSVAAALVRAGLPAVVAMQFPISDAAALAFSGAFYGALATGEPVDAAMVEGRWAIHRNDPDSMEWVTPALYLSVEDGRLFDLSPLASRPLWERLRRRAAGALDSPSGRRLLAALVLIGTCWGSWAAVDPGFPYRSWLNPPECPSPPGLGLRFALIPAGAGVAGPFCLGKFEVTRRQWRRVMGEEALPAEPGDGELPAVGISREEALEFLRRIASGTSSAVCRLPTEAEWEQAAGAEADTAYGFGDDPRLLPRYGNCRSPGGGPGDGYDRLAPVGSFEATRWGLYDLHGNAFEWVADDYRPDPSRAGPPDPPPAGRGVRRGGSFESSPESCRTRARSAVQPDLSHHDTGFRVVREPARQPSD